jgi:hypothetical protein
LEYHSYPPFHKSLEFGLDTFVEYALLPSGVFLLHDLVLPTASILFQNLPKGCSSLNFDLIVVVINCFLIKTDKIN